MNPTADKRTYQKVLTIAGSDSGGGAGIQADLKTVSAIGCYGLWVITALTAQNTRGVTGIHPVPPSFVAEQMVAVLSDKGFDIEEAVRRAKTYIQNAIRAGADYRIGRGHGPVHHFFEFWQ